MAISKITDTAGTTHEIYIKQSPVTDERPLLLKKTTGTTETTNNAGISTTVSAGSNFVRIGSPTIAYDATNKCLNFNF